jgi:PAS domain S-box-containing protein
MQVQIFIWEEKMWSSTLRASLLLFIVTAATTSLAHNNLPITATILLSVTLGMFIAIFYFRPYTEAVKRYGTFHMWSPKASVQSLDVLIHKQQKDLAQHRTITNSLIVSVLIADPKTNEITFCSPYTEVLTGYSTSEIYRRGISFLREIIHEQHTDFFERALQFAKAGEPYQFQHSFHHRTGIDVWAETRTMPLLDDNGECTAVLIVALNISQQMVYQRQVEERTREVQDFTYMLSHDLKAPLFTLKGMVSILSERADKEDKDYEDLLKHVSRAVSRLETLVSSVLEYAKISSLGVTVQPTSLKEAICDAIGDFSQQLHECHAQIDIADELPHVEADSIRLTQIMSNLVSNAIKYRETERALSLSFSLLPSASRRMTTLIVQDNGSGIPANRLDSIFRPFQRAHGSHIEGSGIGLASVRKLLEKFGGSIDVQSEQGKGSTFLVTFRRAEL